MKILLREQIDKYRFAVAKIVFLLVEDRFKLINDIVNSNLMLVYDIEDNQYVYISVLSQPTTNRYINETIHVYYQKARYRRYQSITNKKNFKSNNVKVNCK